MAQVLIRVDLFRPYFTYYFLLFCCCQFSGYTLKSDELEISNQLYLLYLPLDYVGLLITKIRDMPLLFLSREFYKQRSKQFIVSKEKFKLIHHVNC